VLYIIKSISRGGVELLSTSFQTSVVRHNRHLFYYNTQKTMDPGDAGFNVESPPKPLPAMPAASADYYYLKAMEYLGTGEDGGDGGDGEDSDSDTTNIWRARLKDCRCNKEASVFSN
jgi:hypothetical protein